MKPFINIGVIAGAITIVVASIFFEVWLLGLILSWFGVTLSFWQNFAIIVLANMIFKSNVSSK